MLRLPLDEASAKVRTGGPIDDDEDMDLAVWAGVVPLRLVRRRAGRRRRRRPPPWPGYDLSRGGQR